MLHVRGDAVYVGKRWFDFIRTWGKGRKVHPPVCCSYLPACSLLLPMGAVLEWLSVSSLLALEVQGACLLPLSVPGPVSA